MGGGAGTEGDEELARALAAAEAGGRPRRAAARLPPGTYGERRGRRGAATGAGAAEGGPGERRERGGSAVGPPGPGPASGAGGGAERGAGLGQQGRAGGARGRGRGAGAGGAGSPGARGRGGGGGGARGRGAREVAGPRARPGAREGEGEVERALREEWRLPAVCQFCQLFGRDLKLRAFSTSTLLLALAEPSAHQGFLSELVYKILRVRVSCPPTPSPAHPAGPRICAAPGPRWP